MMDTSALSIAVAAANKLEQNDRLLKENMKLKRDLEMANSALKIYDQVFGTPQRVELKMPPIRELDEQWIALST